MRAAHKTSWKEQDQERLEARFWKKVDTKGSDECWLWKAGLSMGYGRLGWDGYIARAHRVAFEIFHHRKPRSLVLRKCGNRACANPRHLYEGNQVANLRDLFASGGGCRKLSNEDVREVVRLDKASQYSRRELATKFGCSPQNIGKILNGQVYLYIEQEY